MNLFVTRTHHYPLTHIAKSWKIFPKIGWWLRGFLGKFFQTFFKISDFGSWVRSISGKFFQPNFLSTYSGKKFVFWFRVMSEKHFWKMFPASFHECLLRKKVCFRYLGMTRKSFWSFLSHINNTGILSLWNALLHQWESEIGHFDGLDVDHVAKFVWKNFPEILLSHHPKIVNFNFYLKSCILEKFSKNSPESWPKILKMAFGNIFQKTSWVITRIFRCDQFWTQIFEIGNLRGLLWYHA